MESKKIVFRETAIIALGQLVCTGLMFAVFALLGKFDRSVLLGGVIGSVMTVANFFTEILTQTGYNTLYSRNVIVL